MKLKNPNPKGLGDIVENITEATGIAKIVHTIFGDDCGCDERKAKLNKIFPFKTECLNEEEFNYLNQFNWSTTQITQNEQNQLLKIYNRVFNLRQKHSNCKQCWIDIIKRLDVLYKEYLKEIEYQKKS